MLEVSCAGLVFSILPESMPLWVCHLYVQNESIARRNIRKISRLQNIEKTCLHCFIFSYASRCDNYRAGYFSSNHAEYVGFVQIGELVFDESGCLVIDPLNAGAFNYFSLKDLRGVPRFVTDMVPYMIFGNSIYGTFMTDKFSTTWGKFFK